MPPPANPAGGVFLFPCPIQLSARKSYLPIISSAVYKHVRYITSLQHCQHKYSYPISPNTKSEYATGSSIGRPAINRA